MFKPAAPGGGNTLFASLGADLTAQSSSTGVESGGVDETVTLTIQLTSPGTISFNANWSHTNATGNPAGSFTATDSSSPITSFDAIGFGTNGSTATQIELDNVIVTTAPEPASLALLASATAGLLARRRSRSKHVPDIACE